MHIISRCAYHLKMGGSPPLTTHINDEDLGRRLFQAEEARLPVEAASTPPQNDIAPRSVDGKIEAQSEMSEERAVAYVPSTRTSRSNRSEASSVGGPST